MWLTTMLKWEMEKGGRGGKGQRKRILYVKYTAMFMLSMTCVVRVTINFYLLSMISVAHRLILGLKAYSVRPKWHNIYIYTYKSHCRKCILCGIRKLFNKSKCLFSDAKKDPFQWLHKIGCSWVRYRRNQTDMPSHKIRHWTIYGHSNVNPMSR